MWAGVAQSAIWLLVLNIFMTESKFLAGLAVFLTAFIAELNVQ
jgi:hypothetical protein